MIRSRAFRGVAALAGLASVVACSTFGSGTTDPPDAIPEGGPGDADRPAPVDAATDGADAALDGPSMRCVVPHDFKSPNGAVFTTTDAGTTIVAAGGAAHALIVPVSPPSITDEDFTVHATVSTTSAGEFGLITRGQPDGGAAVVFGSSSADGTRSFLGTFGAPNWNPALAARGPVYVYRPNERFKLRLRAVGSQISSKIWDADTPEPTAFEANFSAPWTSGRGFGFYAYAAGIAVLESLCVSTP